MIMIFVLASTYRRLATVQPNKSVFNFDIDNVINDNVMNDEYNKTLSLLNEATIEKC